MSVVHEHDCVGFEFAELADSEAGAGEHLDHQTADRVSVAGSAHQLRCVGVGQEFGEWVVGCGEVAVEDQDAFRGVGVVPFRDAFEERAQRAEHDPDPLRRQGAPGLVPGEPGAEVSFERLNMFPVDVGESADRWELGRQEASELAQDAVGSDDAGRAQRHSDLVQVALHRRS